MKAKRGRVRQTNLTTADKTIRFYAGSWLFYFGGFMGILVTIGVPVELYLALTDYGLPAFFRNLPNWSLTITIAFAIAYLGWKIRRSERALQH